MFFFDPTYLVFILPGLALSLWASFRTKSAFRKYSKVRCARHLTGAQAARLMLDRAGLHDVSIGRSHGILSDHYNPATRRLALSKDVHDAASIAAIGVATHEAGHAIQHAAHYAPLWLRSTLVPTANIGSSIGYVVMMIGLFMASQSLVGRWRGPVLGGPSVPGGDSSRGVRCHRSRQETRGRVRDYQ